MPDLDLAVAAPRPGFEGKEDGAYPAASPLNVGVKTNANVRARNDKIQRIALAFDDDQPT
jgi:hypothetical protein